MPARAAAKKPLLTKKMVKKRLAFCKKYLKWTPAQWENVMFSDESTFRLVNSRGIKVRRISGISRYKQRYTVPTVKHSASVMVWGCFRGKRGRGGLYFLPKNCTMNGEQYKTVLENHLLPFMRIHGAKLFLQEGTPCHTSKLVLKRLKEMEGEFKLLDWPGNSPDLNPIENCWSFMKHKLKAEKFETNSLPKLINAIKKMWVAAPAAVLREPGALHAQKAQGCPGEQGSDDQVLKMSSKLKKYMYVSCLPNCYFLHFEKSTFSFLLLKKKKYPP